MLLKTKRNTRNIAKIKLKGIKRIKRSGTNYVANWIPRRRTNR